MKSIRRRDVEAELLAYLSTVANNEGETFGVTFVKKNGELRTMTCRFGVKKHLRGGERSWSREQYPQYLTVFDMNKKGYRTVNLDTLRRVAFGGEEYHVVR